MKFVKSLMLSIVLSLSGVLSAQTVALKSNLVSDAALSPNLGAEVTIAPKWSLELSGQVNFWTVDNRKWKHWLLSPEARYWFCEPYTGHFLGIHALGGEFNVANLKLPFSLLGNDFRALRDNRYQGWGIGAGIAYGYSWLLGRHWNLEAEIGIGYIWSKYDRYECLGCGRKVEAGKTRNYVGPTKAALNLVYVF